MKLKGKRVLVLGLGASGMSMARWLARRGAEVRVADTRPEPPFADALRAELPGVELHLGALREESFADVTTIAISPGVPLSEPQVQKARARGVAVLGDIELFARIRDEFADAKVIAITGSNGKSTVTEMVGAMCRAASTRTLVAGNIGLPVLDAVSDIDAGRRRKPDVFVLELSSFQLETTQSLDANAAAVLNLSEDHLDRYAGIRDYAEAKSRIFLGSGVQVLNRQDSWTSQMAQPGRCAFTFGLDEPESDRDWGLRSAHGETWLAQGDTLLLRVEELKVAGMHNAANALAALALCRAIRLPYPPLLDALRAFEGLPHRVQKVAEIGGVAFFDDSKGTNVGATVAALEGMPQKAVVILGGDGKGQDFAPLKGAVSRHARAAVLVGRDGPRIAAAISGCGVPVEPAQDMDDAVLRAYALAQPGDVVLLSPACASFDMFDNYEHRAQAYFAAVRALETRH